MDKGQALQQFWESFDLPAIDEQSAYDPGVLEQLQITMPHITYEGAFGNFTQNVQLTASIWYRSTSWAEITRKAEEIAAFIGYGGKSYPIDGGYMKVMLPEGRYYWRGPEDTDNTRRMFFTIEVMYLTAT